MVKALKACVFVDDLQLLHQQVVVCGDEVEGDLSFLGEECGRGKGTYEWLLCALGLSMDVQRWQPPHDENGNEHSNA